MCVSGSSLCKFELRWIKIFMCESVIYLVSFSLVVKGKENAGFACYTSLSRGKDRILKTTLHSHKPHSACTPVNNFATAQNSCAQLKYKLTFALKMLYTICVLFKQNVCTCTIINHRWMIYIKTMRKQSSSLNNKDIFIYHNISNDRYSLGNKQQQNYFLVSWQSISMWAATGCHWQAIKWLPRGRRKRVGAPMK